MELGRLKTRSEFLRVAANARKCVKPGLILQAARRKLNGDTSKDPGTIPRIGFTVTRRVGTAVARNRARRRLRAAAREVFPKLAAPGHDYVVIARRETLARKFSDLVSDMAEALRSVRTPKKEKKTAAR